MHLDRHSREIIGGGIKFEQSRILLQEAEAQTDHIADEHSDEQQPQRAKQEHITHELVGSAHGLHESDGRSAFDNDYQQHADDSNASHQEHKHHNEPDIRVEQVEPIEDLRIAFACGIRG